MQTAVQVDVHDSLFDLLSRKKQQLAKQVKANNTYAKADSQSLVSVDREPVSKLSETA